MNPGNRNSIAMEHIYRTLKSEHHARILELWHNSGLNKIALSYSRENIARDFLNYIKLNDSDIYRYIKKMSPNYLNKYIKSHLINAGGKRKNLKTHKCKHLFRNRKCTLRSGNRKRTRRNRK